MLKLSTLPGGIVEVGSAHLEVEIDIFEFEAIGSHLLG